MAESDAGIEDLVGALLTASRALVAVSAQSLAALDDSVTLVQFRALVVLDAQAGCNLNALAQQLDVTASTAMRTIDRLLAAGLVTRSENPLTRREVVLGLTPAGRQLVEEVTGRRRKRIAAIATGIPVADREQVVAALRAFARAAGEPPARGEWGW